MTDTPPSDCPTQGAEFDMMSALDWKDGIATLPGSDIRVRNKFAILSAFVPMQSIKTKRILSFDKEAKEALSRVGGGARDSCRTDSLLLQSRSIRCSSDDLKFLFCRLSVPHD